MEKRLNAFINTLNPESTTGSYTIIELGCVFKLIPFPYLLELLKSLLKGKYEAAK